MKKKKCNSPGCGNLIDMGERYCAKHIHGQPVRKCFEKAGRPNAELYNTSRWRKLRREVLKQYPYCFKCGVSGGESPLQAHHLIPPKGDAGLFFDGGNLVSVCPACHRILTGKETAEGKRKYGR
jgi:5-methylcytosine-specific restriction protein A